MDELRNTYNAGRAAMRAAFAELSTAARWAGVDEDTITALHGRFFDGHVQLKSAGKALFLLASLRAHGKAHD